MIMLTSRVSFRDELVARSVCRVRWILSACQRLVFRRSAPRPLRDFRSSALAKTRINSRSFIEPLGAARDLSVLGISAPSI